VVKEVVDTNGVVVLKLGQIIENDAKSNHTNVGKLILQLEQG